MNKLTDYGPGDPDTWPAYTGHPNDPRAPAEPGLDYEIEQILESRHALLDVVNEALADPESIDQIAALLVSVAHGDDEETRSELLDILSEPLRAKAARMRQIAAEAEEWVDDD